MRLLLVSDELRSSDHPKLGLGYLASYLKKYLPEITISLAFDNDNLADKINSFHPDIVGFSAMTPTFSRQIAKAKLVKNKFNLPLIIGGVHVSLVPTSLPTWFDIGIIGEGEETLRRVLIYYKENNKLQNPNINGLVYWNGGQLVKTGPPQLVEPIDKIPFPDWNFLQIGPSGPGHIMTSRGCPYHCRFCESGNFWKKYRAHSAEYIVDEIKTIYGLYHRKELIIMDDLFFLNQTRLEQILTLLEKEGLNKKMRFEVIGRVDLFNEKVVDILKKMNVYAISFGMESGSERVLKYLKKETITLDQIRNAVNLAKKHNMQVLGTFMVGSPRETISDIKKTIAFIKELDLDQVGINVTTPLPGTPLWDIAKEKGLVVGDRWDERLWGMRDVNKTTINNKLLLTDIPKNKFLLLLKEIFTLQDWTHRKRRNQQLYYKYIKQPNYVNFIRFIAHCVKRPKESLYNFRSGKFTIN